MTEPVRKMTEEKRARIAELWNLGWTSSHIADAVGLTRNSVIGAVHRLRKNGAIMSTRDDRKKPRVAKKSHEHPIRKNIKPNIELGKPVNILKLAFQSCRYIVEEGNVYETKYCNNKIHKEAYCKDHYKVCYTPVRKPQVTV